MAKRKKRSEVHMVETHAWFGGGFFRKETAPTPGPKVRELGWVKAAAKWAVGGLVSGGLTITIWWIVIPDNPQPAPRALPEVIWC